MMMIFVNISISYFTQLTSALRCTRSRSWCWSSRENGGPCSSLVKDGKIKSLEEIYLYSLPIKEHKIIDMFIGPALKDEVLKIMPVQKQTRAGQRTRFNAFVGKFYAYFV